jgi:hypothetical protein
MHQGFERCKFGKTYNFFGQVRYRNGYSYVHCQDPKLITKVKNLFMIIHQKPCVPTTQIISIKMARTIVY